MNPPIRTTPLLLALPLLFGLAGCGDPEGGGDAPPSGPEGYGAAETIPERESDEERYEESRFHRQPDLFLAADDPEMVAAAEVTFLEEEDEVFGLVMEDGRARAYDVRALSYHHVINDRIDGVPVAVTY